MGWPIIIGIALVLNYSSAAGLAKGSLVKRGTNNTCLIAAVETREPFLLIEKVNQTLIYSGFMTEIIEIIGKKLGRWLGELGLHVKEAKEKHVTKKESFRRSLWNSCYWTLGSILAQSCSWSPTGNSIRVMTGLWLLLSLVVNTVYRSNLKAMLILPKVQLPFDSMEELVQTGIKTYVPAGSYMYQAMMQAPEGTLLHKLQKQAFVHFDLAKAARDALSGKSASFVGLATFKSFMINALLRTGKCPLMYRSSETFFGATPNSLTFPKGSPLLPQIDPILLSLKESGIFNFLFDTANAKFLSCTNLRVTNTSRSLELGDFYAVFLIYIGGMVLSLIAFAMEIFTENRKSKESKFGNLDSPGTKTNM
ncbi:glutamate receptor-like [Palaemon carinicauda]|uniref:glutamate receptor-like n=1 Tax=Palaemon carinicauda TaxID=392227 RepID=UPI0035B69243